MNSCSIQMSNTVIPQMVKDGTLSEMPLVETIYEMEEIMTNGTDVDILKGYSAEQFIEALRRNPKLQAAKPTLETLKSYINTVDSFARLVKNTYDVNKSPIQNLEAILDRYYSDAMTVKPLEVIFKEIDSVKDITWNKEQQEAVDKISNWAKPILDNIDNLDDPNKIIKQKSEFFTLVGKGGTGKTTVVCQCLYDIIKQWYRKSGKLPNIATAALSHKAKDVLGDSLAPLERLYSPASGANAMFGLYSIAQLTGGKMVGSIEDGSYNEELEINDDNLYIPAKEADIIIVDECSMVTPELFYHIQNMRKQNSLLIFLGDSGQCPPILGERKAQIASQKEYYLKSIDALGEGKEGYIPGSIYGEDRNINIQSLYAIPFGATENNSHSLLKRMRSGEEHPLLEYADKFWNDNYKPAEWNNKTMPTKITNEGAFIVTNNFDDLSNDAIVDMYAKAVQDKDPNRVQFCSGTREKRTNYNLDMHSKVKAKLGKKDEVRYTPDGVKCTIPFFIGEPVYLDSSSNFVTNNTRGIITKISELKRGANRWVKTKVEGQPIQNDDYNFYYVEVTFQDTKGQSHTVNYVPMEYLGNLYDKEEEERRKKNGEEIWNISQYMRPQDEESPSKSTTRISAIRSKYGVATDKEGNVENVLLHGYAATTHKVQGSTFDVAIVDYTGMKAENTNQNGLVSDDFNHLLYTAATRASNTLIVFDSVSKENFSTLPTSLDKIVEKVALNKKSASNRDAERVKISLNNAALLKEAKEEDTPWFKTVQQKIKELKELAEKSNDKTTIVDADFLERLSKAASTLIKNSGMVAPSANFLNEASGKDTVGLYVQENATTYLRTRNLYNYNTAVHEILHLISDYAIEQRSTLKQENPKLYDALNRLDAAYSVFKEKRSKNIQTEYATESLKEFISELSNPNVIAEIQEIDKRENTGIMDAIRQFFANIFEYIKSKFGKQNTTLFDFTKDALDDLINYADNSLFNTYTAMLYQESSNKQLFSPSATAFFNNGNRTELLTPDTTGKTQFISKAAKYPSQVIPEWYSTIPKGVLFESGGKFFYTTEAFNRGTTIFQKQDFRERGRVVEHELNSFNVPVQQISPLEMQTKKLNARKVHHEKLGDIWVLDTNNPMEDSDMDFLKLEYNLQQINKEEEKRIKNAEKTLLKETGLLADRAKFHLKYPLATEQDRAIMENATIGDELTKDEWLRIADILNVPFDYVDKSFSDFVNKGDIIIREPNEIVKYLNDTSVVKAYRMGKWSDPQEAFNTKVIGNPFKEWTTVKEDSIIANSLRTDDQIKFTQWLMTGKWEDGFSSYEPAKNEVSPALRSAFLSIIEEAATQGKKVMYYTKEVDEKSVSGETKHRPIDVTESHSAVVKYMIDNWDKIKDSVAPFDRYTSVAKDGETYKENGKELVFYRGFSADTFNTNWESTSQKAVDYANGIQGWIHSTSNEDTASRYADVHQEKDYLPTQVAEVKLRANAKVRHFKDVQEYNKLYSNGEINLDEIDAIILDKGTTFGDESELIARPTAMIASNVADKETDVWFGKGENDPLRSNPQFSNFGHGVTHTLLGQQKFNFKTVEGAYQASKLDYANIPMSEKLSLAERLANADGAEARNIGRGIRNLDTKKWDSESTNIMLRLMEKSFNQNPDLRDELIRTHRKFTHKNADAKWATLFPSILQEVRKRAEFRKRFDKWSKDTMKAGVRFGMPTYGESIPSSDANDPNVVFVFGSNPVGVNGRLGKTQSEDVGGAAAFAQRYFGVEAHERMDNTLSKNGRAYGLTTVTKPGAKKSLTKEQITENIVKLYETARQHPEKTFKVAYNNDDNQTTLNGYTGAQMKKMFWDAAIKFGSIPKNIQFSEKYAGVGMASADVFKSFEGNSINPTAKKTNALQGYTFHSGGAVGADSFWAEVARETGAKYNGYYVDSSKNPQEGNIEVIWAESDAEYDELSESVKDPNKIVVLEKDAKDMVSLAASQMHRNITNMVEAAAKGNKTEKDKLELIKRDYVQVMASDQIVAIGELTPDMHVNGGTGWAVEMAKILNRQYADSGEYDKIKPIYVFDTITNQWHKSDSSSYFANFFPSGIPVLTQNTACIGTRGEKVGKNTIFKEEWKNELYKVVHKTILAAHPNKDEWEALLPDMSSEYRDSLFKDKDWVKPSSKIDTNPAQEQEIAQTTKNVCNNEITIRKFNNAKTFGQVRAAEKEEAKNVESMLKLIQEKGGFTIRETNHKDAYNKLLELVAAAPQDRNEKGQLNDIFRYQIGKTMIIATIKQYESDIEGKGVRVTLADVHTVKLKDKQIQVGETASNAITDLSGINQKVELKKSIKSSLGTDVYSHRITYLNRRFRNYLIKEKNRLMSEGKAAPNTKFGEIINLVGYEEAINRFKMSLGKHLPENVAEDQREADKDSVLNDWVELAVKTGQIENIQSEKDRLKAEYIKNGVFEKKQDANRQILNDENWETFLNDMLALFGRENDVIIEYNQITRKTETKEVDTEAQQNENSDDTTITDTDYETVETWQAREAHALSSASTRLKLFLSNIPMRDVNGNIKFDDIEEPIFLSANRVYNEMQVLMDDCFTADDLLNKLHRLGKTNPIYKSISSLLRGNNGKRLVTEIFILLNNEEINYEDWRVDYTKNSGKVYKAAYEKITNEIDDTRRIIRTAILDGISYASNSEGSRVNIPLNASDLTSIVDAERNADGSVAVSASNVLRGKIQEYRNTVTAVQKVYEPLITAAEQGVIVVGDYLSMFDKNSGSFKDRLAELKKLATVMHNIGINISIDDLVSAAQHITNDNPLPMVKICSAVNNFLDKFSRYISQHPKLDKNMADFLSDKSYKAYEWLSDIAEAAPMYSAVVDKQAVTYINGNNYPKYKPLSALGLILKHLKDGVKIGDNYRRDEYINKMYKQFSWFYTPSNADDLITLLKQQPSPETEAIITEIKKFKNSINETERKQLLNEVNDSLTRLPAKIKANLNTKTNAAKLLLNDEEWANDTLKQLMGVNSMDVCQRLQRHRIVAFQKQDYFKWDKEDFILMSFDKFFRYQSDKDSQYADFLMPIYSDAGVMEFITLPKVGKAGTSHEEKINACLNSLMKTYNQELGRIKLMHERKQQRQDIILACNAFIQNKSIDKVLTDSDINGVRAQFIRDRYNEFKGYDKETVQPQFSDWYSMPIQNLEDVEEVTFDGEKWVMKTKKNGKGKTLNFFSFLYNYYPELDNQNVSQDQIREVIAEELHKEAVKIQQIIDTNKYNKYDKKARKYVSMESQNGEYSDDVEEYVYENMCANIAITQLTVTDLAQYGGAIDFQKRFKEVYAGTKRINTTYDEQYNRYARKEYVQILLKDVFAPRNGEDFCKLVEASDLPRDQKDWLIATYSKINLTDAQSYRSLSSMRAVMCMQGEWNEYYQAIYDAIRSGKRLTFDQMRTFFQPRKPFVFTHKTVDAKNGKDKMKVGFQIKNSEFLLMYIYSQTNTLFGSNAAVIQGINQWMEDNRIDCVHFNSGVKVGGQGVIDLQGGKQGKQLLHPDLEPVLPVVNPRDFDGGRDDEEYATALRNSLITASKNVKWQIGYTEEQISQMETADLRKAYATVYKADQKRIKQNVQNLLYKVTKLARPTTHPEMREVEENGKKVTKEVEIGENDKQKLERLKKANQEFVNIIQYDEYGIISSTPEHFLGKKQKLGTQLMRLLTSDNLGGTSLKHNMPYTVRYGGETHNLSGPQLFYHLSKLLAAKALIHHEKIDNHFKDDNQLLAYLLKQMKGNSKYSDATMDAISHLDENGRLDLLGDPVVKTQIESLINSFIREEVNNVEVDGGTCIQVTAAFADDLHIRYTNDEKGNRIKYWECRMPIGLKEVYNLAADKNGVLSVNTLMNNKNIDDLTKQKLLECVGCRVPTESKHSIQHFKCVGFLPSNSGSCIMLPYEITKTSGADFDIDKIYTWRHSFKIVSKEVSYTDKNGETKTRTIKVPEYIDYKDTAIHEMSEEQINNAIIDLFWEVLEHPESAIQELYPNSYDQTQKAAYIGTLFFNSEFDKRIQNEFNKYYDAQVANGERSSKPKYTNGNKLEFLKSMDIDKLQSWYEVGLNRCSLLNQSYFFDLNSKGKGMLGIMAVNNVFLSLLQHTNVQIAPQYRVMINNQEKYDLHSVTQQKDGNEVLSSLTLSEFLAAAPDSAKDPTLVFLGINNQNVNALVGAALLNYDIQDIALMFNHPVLKEFFRDVKSSAILSPNDIAMKIIRMFTPSTNGKYNYDETKQYLAEFMSYSKTGQTFKGSDGEKVELREIELHPINTRDYNITEDDLLGNNVDDEGNITDESKIRILVGFYKLFLIGKDLNNLAQVTRQDSTSGSNSATFAGNISKSQKIERIMYENSNDLTALEGAGDLLHLKVADDNVSKEDLIKFFGNEDDASNPLGYIQVQLTYGLLNAEKYGQGRFPDYSPFMRECYNVLKTITPYGYLNEKTIKLMVGDFIKWRLSKLPFFGRQEINGQIIDIQQKMAIIINEMWDDINNIKYEYDLMDNKLLNTLKPNDKGVITIEDAGNLTPEAKKDLTDAWEELINSPYNKVRMLGYNLIRYSFYRNGLKFAPDGFGHLCPDVRKVIPGYVNAMRECLTFNDSSQVMEFLSRFMCNNAKYLQQTKKQNRRDDQIGWISINAYNDDSIESIERKAANAQQTGDEGYNSYNDDYTGDYYSSYSGEEYNLYNKETDEASYEAAHSSAKSKNYSLVILGNNGKKDKFLSLTPAQIVPTTNITPVLEYDNDSHSYIEVLKTVDSSVNDFTYYPAKDGNAIWKEFMSLDDAANQTFESLYEAAVTPISRSNARKEDKDMYDILQEYKDNNQLTTKHKLC